MSPFSAILQVLFPTTCACCGDVLVRGERQVCIKCLANMSATNFSTMYDNPVERRLVGRIPLVNATAIYYFHNGNAVRNAVHAMKFHGNAELCLMMGRQMGLSLLGSGRFDDIDLLVPVPLHWLRRFKRGYNQSELLCKGIAEVMHLPVCAGAVLRHRYTRQQSLQSGMHREKNVEGAFKVRKPGMLAGKHILLVDDVLTTGATIVACADAITTVHGVRISVATFCTAE